jgi:hypothetical protein
MIDVSIKIEGIDKIIKGMEKAPEMTVNEVSKAIQGSLNRVRSTAIREAPVGKGDNAGALRKSIQPYKMETKLRGMVEVTAPYAEAVHQGSRPHEIKPKTKKALAFEVGGFRGYVMSSSGKSYYQNKRGESVVVKHVHHPGYRGDPFMIRAIEKSMGEISKFFENAIKNIMNSIIK